MSLYGKGLLIVCLFAACVFGGSTTVMAQRPAAKRTPASGWSDCEGWIKMHHAAHCEVRTLELPAPSGRVVVDGGQNGDVHVTGWDSDGMLVRARVQTFKAYPYVSTDKAHALAAEIKIETDGDRIRARRTSDETLTDVWWAVGFDIYLPRRADVTIKTDNGGVGVSGLRGRTEFEVNNGGATLSDLAGDVRGRVTNGGLHVRLAGARWDDAGLDGAGLDARTVNGGVTVEVPEGYAARLAAETVNGGVRNDLSAEGQAGARGEPSRTATLNSGAGGASVRVATTNGGVRIKRRAAS